MTVPDVKLRNAKPSDKPYRISVGDNLYLEVMTTGRKIWRMRYRQSGSKVDTSIPLDNIP